MEAAGTCAAGIDVEDAVFFVLSRLVGMAEEDDVNSGGGRLEVPNEDAGVRVILNSIASLNVQDVGRQVLEYLNAGYSGDRLLHEMGRVMLWDDTNTRILPTLRTVFEEWERSSGSDPALGAGHPARYQLLVGLAR